jgi:hypothetical protein
MVIMVNKNSLHRNWNRKTISSQESNNAAIGNSATNSQAVDIASTHERNFSNSVARSNPAVTVEKAYTDIEATKLPDRSLTLPLNHGSGQRAVLSPDGTGLSVLGKSGEIMWSNNIISEIGADRPQYFTGRIESMHLYGENFVLIAGNGYYYIDKSNGKITNSGQR